MGATPLLAQDITFTQLTKNYTNCIINDSEGYVWISTQNGLLRYDSYEFRTFRYNPKDPKSLPNNFVWEMVQDDQGQIWAGTFGGGFAMYNKNTQQFTTYNCAPIGNSTQEANSVRALELEGDSLLWLGTENGVYGFDIHKKEFKKGAFWERLNHTKWFVYDIEVVENQVFVATENGLFQIQKNHSEEIFQRITLAEDSIQTITDLEAHQGRLYIGTEKGLLVGAIGNLKNTQNHFTANNQKETRVHYIFFDSKNELWLGTENGLGRYTPSSGYTWYRENPQKAYSLSSNIIHYIEEVAPGKMMAATRKGVVLFSNEPPVFENLNRIYNITGCSKTALGMTEDHEKNIWICSRKGLTKIDVQKNVNDWTGTCYLPENTKGMIDAYTINITQDKAKDFWVAYRFNGFSKLRIVNGKQIWTSYPKTTARFNGEGVNQIFQDTEGQYWIATRGFGLMAFFPNQDSVVVYNEKEGLSHPYIFRIYEDSKKQLWVGTANGGLCSFDRSTKKFNCFTHAQSKSDGLSSNMVLSVSEDNKNRLWVSTVDGLNVRLGEDDSFTKITMLDGLPNNVVYAAVSDPEGKLWIPTDGGIVRMDFDQNKIDIETFSTGDGLVGSEFNQHAFLKHSSGLFLFGSVDGVVVFDPISLVSREQKPKVVLTDFLLFNITVPVKAEYNVEENSSKIYLEKAINELEQITLPYNQNTLSFQFAAIDFSPSKNIQYAYKMEGLDPDWVVTKDRRFAAYPKIASGTYDFKVKTIGKNKEANADIKTIKIIINPPPWKTWWAYSIYVFLFCLSIYLLLWAQKERSRIIEKAKAAERDRFRKKMSQDFHDEAGNKITLITLLADRAERKAESADDVKSLMTEMQSQIQSLRIGMRDFIWVMDPSRDTVFDAVIRLRDFGIHFCEQAEIQFVEEGRTDALRQIHMNGNVRRHFLLIFKEAINNAIKYSEASKIIFEIEKDNEKGLIFNLIDNGNGFEIAQETNGNGMKNMQSRATQINATLLVTSRKRGGTRISLTWASI